MMTRRLCSLISLLLLVHLLCPPVVAAENTVQLTILPGPFTAALTQAETTLILVIDDATGSGQGWWVTVMHDGPITLVSDLELIIGQPIDPDHGPIVLHDRPDELMVFADLGYGTGVYQLALAPASGSYLITTSYGFHTSD